MTPRLFGAYRRRGEAHVLGKSLDGSRFPGS
jgi:hypothetical protein